MHFFVYPLGLNNLGKGNAARASKSRLNSPYFKDTTVK
jgi:hypothetical protein